jgi:hypothetical protein
MIKVDGVTHSNTPMKRVRPIGNAAGRVDVDKIGAIEATVVEAQQ